jgi:hypothetical protein
MRRHRFSNNPLVLIGDETMAKKTVRKPVTPRQHAAKEAVDIGMAFEFGDDRLDPAGITDAVIIGKRHDRRSGVQYGEVARFGQAPGFGSDQPHTVIGEALDEGGGLLAVALVYHQQLESEEPAVQDGCHAPPQIVRAVAGAYQDGNGHFGAVHASSTSW